MTPSILLTRARDAERETLDEYRGQEGYNALQSALESGGPAVLDAIEAARLRGRGGASFPVSKKWKISSSAEADVKYVVANGGEHEPGSNKDKHLVAKYPHRVLEGMLLCGLATGASKGWLYLIEDMSEQIEAAEAAIREALSARLIGDDILGRGFDFEVEIHRAPPTYVAGEETAAIDSIEGGEGKPRSKPPYPGDMGIFGRPTTVNNVETLAHVPWIVRNGAEAYAAIGTEASTGTMLFTLGEEVERPGVYELPFGSCYRELVFDHGGGPKGGKQIRALLPALSSTFLGPEHLDTPICYDGFRAFGSSPGCGGVHLVLEGDDVVTRVFEIAEFFKREQCGQCPPCRMETNQFVQVLDGVRSGVKGDFRAHLTRIAKFAHGKGRCSLIEMAAAPVLSAAQLFADDFARYAR